MWNINSPRTLPPSASLLPTSNYNSLLPTMARSLLISQTPVSRFLQHEYQDCYCFGRRRTTRFFFTKVAATSEWAISRLQPSTWFYPERKKEKRSELTRRKARATTCDSSSSTDQFSHGDARRNSFTKAPANWSTGKNWTSFHLRDAMVIWSSLWHGSQQCVAGLTPRECKERLRRIKKPCRNPREKHRLLLLLLPSRGNFCQSSPPTPFLLACSCKSSNPNPRRPADTYQDTEKVWSKIHMPQDRRETITRMRETKCENELRIFRIHKSTVFVSCRFSHLVWRSSVNPPSLEDFVPISWTGLNHGQGAIAGSLASRENVVVVASPNRTTSPRILRQVEAHFLFPICHCGFYAEHGPAWELALETLNCFTFQGHLRQFDDLHTIWAQIEYMRQQIFPLGCLSCVRSLWNPTSLAV